MFVPYTLLSQGPVDVLVCGGVPVSLRLSRQDSRVCLISLSSAHRFQWGPTASVSIGTAFELEYNGVVCEIRLGRKFIVLDA
jgi:hypothetical protein